MKQGERHIVEWPRIISQFSRDQLNCLSTNQPNDERAFRARTSIISCVCERENILRNICCWAINNVCKTDKRSFVDAPYMV